MKNVFKVLEAMRSIAIIALFSIIGFRMIACSNPAGGGSGGNGTGVNTGGSGNNNGDNNGGDNGGNTGGGTLLTLSGDIAISPNSGVATFTELAATYTGSETVSYHWEKDGSSVGTNSNKYRPTQAGSYTVTVSAARYNSKTSAPVVTARQAMFFWGNYIPKHKLIQVLVLQRYLILMNWSPM